MLLTIYLPVQILQLYVNYVYINEILYIQNIWLYAMRPYSLRNEFFTWYLRALSLVWVGAYFTI